MKTLKNLIAAASAAVFVLAGCQEEIFNQPILCPIFSLLFIFHNILTNTVFGIDFCKIYSGRYTLTSLLYQVGYAFEKGIFTFYNIIHSNFYLGQS